MSGAEKSTISVSRVHQEETVALNKLIQQAFDQDTALHTPATKGGPPGYDNGQLLVKLLRDPSLVCRTVYREGQLQGFFCLAEQTAMICELRLLCVMPSQHNQGLGTAIWRKIEADFPYQIWQVETPAYSLRNHYFYTEKCGFREIGQKKYGENMALIFAKDLSMRNKR